MTYQKAFVIGPYLQEKVGIEIEIDETEQPSDALTEAKRIAETWHIANNPQVHSVDGHPNLLNPDERLLPIISRSEEDRKIGITVEDIMSCTDLTTIDSYRLLIKGKGDLEIAFMKRRGEIVDAEIKELLAQTEK